MSGPYATPDQYAQFWGYWQHKITIAELPAQDVTDLTAQIAMASGDIDMALSAAGALGCTLSGAGLLYLQKLNVINTAVTYRAICGPRLDPDEQRGWMEYLTEQLKLIREGDIELCDGFTGKNFPALGIGQIGWTPTTSAEIQLNALLRRGYR
jgi:hypothetical protein